MPVSALHSQYPWVTPDQPPIISAPMMRITMSSLAVAITSAGGLGFLAAGFDLSGLSSDLSEAAKLVKQASLPCPDNVLPIGVGFQNWGADVQLAINALMEQPVAAVWFFGPKQLSDLIPWTRQIRDISGGKTKIWIQVGTVEEALEVAKTSKPDVLVIQGADAGGHGLAQRAGLMTLLPEVRDVLKQEGINISLVAAGGIIDGRGAAAALALGADGVCLGTRLLACKEAVIAKGYQDEILRAHDGGVHTVNTKVYDVVRGISGWPSTYSGRGVVNQSYLDAVAGMNDEENEARYKEEIKRGDAGWGPDGRMTTYAGTGIGLVREVKSAKEIVEEIQREAVERLRESTTRFSA